MTRKKPHIAQLDEVIITREGDTAIIAYKEKEITTTYLKVGSKLNEMCDQAILDCHNDCIAAQQKLMREYQHIAIEIPPGSSQIEYFQGGGYWIPRGGVLRSQISDGGENYETTILVDDNEFTMKEFGRLLSPYTGWGMRIIMVPEDELSVTPTVEIKNPDENIEGSLSVAAAFTPKNEH